jgi:hypothetical protein
VVSAVIVLTAPGGKIPKDLSWAAGKKMMGNVDQFLKSLISFDKDNTPENCCTQVSGRNLVYVGTFEDMSEKWYLTLLS